MVPGQEAGFADDVAVFAMLETGIGPWVLDYLVTTLTQPEQTGALRGWLRKADAGSLPAGWREGTPTPHDANPRRLARKDIAERISVLGEADWLTEGWSRNADSSTTTAASPMSPHEVHAALRGTPQRAFAIARRDVEPTPEEAKRLRDAGVNVRISQQPPVDVIHELDSPTQKAAVLALATRRHATEGRTRQELAQHGLGLAARRNAQGVRSLSDQVLMLREAMRRELDG